MNRDINLYYGRHRNELENPISRGQELSNTKQVNPRHGYQVKSKTYTCQKFFSKKPRNFSRELQIVWEIQSPNPKIPFHHPDQVTCQHQLQLLKENIRISFMKMKNSRNYEENPTEEGDPNSSVSNKVDTDKAPKNKASNPETQK